MLKKLKNKNEGFTIIEVMIVLAIAGLIMLIVFLAVPALERTSRNTQRKNDAAAIASAISNYASDNAGGLPDYGTFAAATGLATLNCGGTAALATAAGCVSGSTNNETAKIGYYTGRFLSFVNTGSPAIPDTSHVIVDVGYGCNSAGTGATTTTVPRDAAVLYSVESGGGTNSEQCVES
jgi:prepilin-type N-terminal cleavage/methylation domain-containing protein